MSVAPPDGAYITAGVPAEMRAGAELVDGVDIAAPTGGVDPDGTPTHITQIRIPRPDHIPAGPPRIAAQPTPAEPLAVPALPPGVLRYDFALLPGVQASIQLQGDATADHLEQLVEYLTVACKKLREQETRNATRAKWIKPPIPDEVFSPESKPKRRKKDQSPASQPGGE